MLILSLLLGVILAANPDKAPNRPLEKKIEHLLVNAPKFVTMYFVEATPNANDPTHANGPMTKLERRERVATRLTVKLTSLANVVQKAVDADCTLITARGALERFSFTDFKLAGRQILKNYLRLRESISTDQKVCKKMHRKITRKVERYDQNLRTKYCEKVYHEEWCDNEYVYTLDKRVEGTYTGKNGV